MSHFLNTVAVAWLSLSIAVFRLLYLLVFLDLLFLLMLSTRSCPFLLFLEITQNDTQGLICQQTRTQQQQKTLVRLQMWRQFIAPYK